jgi:hypothetical protein
VLANRFGKLGDGFGFKPAAWLILTGFQSANGQTILAAFTFAAIFAALIITIRIRIEEQSIQSPA